VAAGLAGGIVLSGVAGSVWRGAGGAEESLAENAVLQLALWTALVGVVVMAARRKGAGSVVTDFGFALRPGDLAIGVAAGVASQLLLPVVAVLLRPLVGAPDISGPVKDLVDRAHGVAFVGLFLFTVVGAPVVEELFFRGLLLRSLQKRLSDGWSIGLSGLVFGMTHQPEVAIRGRVVVWVSLTVFGVVLSMLAVRTRRLGPGMVAHATFNAVSLLFVALS